MLGGLAIVCGIWGPGVVSMVKARSWQPAESEVIFSDLGIGEQGDRQDAHPLVLYAYRAGGRERMATRLDFFAIRFFSESSARAYAGRYPAGRRVTCFVDPADPTQAVLDRYGLPLDWVNGILALMAASFLSIGGSTLVRALRA
jgi:hypothetical protein